MSSPPNQLYTIAPPPHACLQHKKYILNHFEKAEKLINIPEDDFIHRGWSVARVISFSTPLYTLYIYWQGRQVVALGGRLKTYFFNKRRTGDA